MRKKIGILNSNGLLKINLKNLEYNYKSIEKIVRPSKLATVLKSNCYGLGLSEITKKLLVLKCNNFFLTSYEESIALFKLSARSNIILLNGIINLNSENIKNIFKKKIIPVINSFKELKKFHKIAKKFNSNHKITLHFDTGINRLGIDFNEKDKVINFCLKNNINVFCVMSHLIAADEKKNRINVIQKKKFDEIIRFFPKAIHTLANSNGILNFKKFNYDMVRSGGCIFGTIKSKFLKNVVELYARVLQIRIVNEEHNNFGYNGTFQSKEEKKIAIIGVGYADGFPRTLSNNSYVYFKKKLLPIIGAISMDYIIIDVSKIKYGKIKVGDWVELIGKNISLNEISRKANTIPYEILNSIGNRVKKSYID
tara:strand:- start:874 stop:1977 length:1104 start_codon:yes stop_codon:yes gene_type:complete